MHPGPEGASKVRDARLPINRNVIPYQVLLPQVRRIGKKTSRIASQAH